MKKIKREKISSSRLDGKNRIPSGIPGLDRLIGGGFIQHDVYLLTGPTGSGKTLLGCQFLWEGLQRGENCLYFSLEEAPEDILDDAIVFGWDFRKYEKAGKFYIEYQDPFEMIDVISNIKEKIKKHKSKRLVIDSTSLFGMIFKEEYELRKKLYELIKMLKSLDCVVLLTAEILENSKGLSRYGVEEFVVDGVITLHYWGVGQVAARTLEIRKMRKTDHGKDVYPLVIDKKGIRVEKPD